jgi:hypothetical protein
MNVHPMHTAKTTAAGGLILLASLAGACGGNDAADVERPETVETRPAPTAQATSVTGCIKGGDASGTFVLVTQPEPMGAAVDSATRGQVTTYTYLLEGREVAEHVGREVEVTGTIEESDDIEVEDTREQTAEPTTVDGEKVTPTVEVEEAAVIEMRRMRVDTVQPTGGTCPAPAE